MSVWRCGHNYLARLTQAVGPFHGVQTPWCPFIRLIPLTPHVSSFGEAFIFKYFKLSHFLLLALIFSQIIYLLHLQSLLNKQLCSSGSSCHIDIYSGRTGEVMAQ